MKQPALDLGSDTAVRWLARKPDGTVWKVVIRHDRGHGRFAWVASLRQPGHEFAQRFCSAPSRNELMRRIGDNHRRRFPANVTLELAV